MKHIVKRLIPERAIGWYWKVFASAAQASFAKKTPKEAFTIIYEKNLGGEWGRRPTPDGHTDRSENVMPTQSKFFAVKHERILALMSVLLTSTMWTTQAHSQVDSNSCGHITNHYGPYDYRTQRDKLKIVDEYHFTPEVEALIRGHSGPIAADLAYTLHTSPNHHRALMAMVRLTEKLKNPQPHGMPFTVECYFDRAIRFAPDDTVVRILYAQFLTKRDRTSEALKQLEAAVFYAKDKAFSHYNIGLAYFDLKEYDKALAQAHKALELGFDRTELAGLLKGVNKWQKPVDSEAPKTAN